MGANRSMPRAAVIPEPPYAEFRVAAEWLCRAFGFAERLRIGDHRCQLTVEGRAVVLVAAGDQPSASALLVRLADADSHCASARRRILREPADHPHGERQYSAQDLGGHTWTFSQTVKDVEPAAWGGVLAR